MPYKILSLDGGGIRGLISTVILNEIETRSGQALAELFDLIAGTSTGGLLALGLTKSAPHASSPQFSAADLQKFYESEGQHIFRSTLWRRVSSLSSLTDEKYPHEGLDLALHKFLGEARLKDALTEVLITSYELSRRRAWFFRSARARQDPNYDFPLRDVARATTAAPSYFEPLHVEGQNGDDGYTLIDGGVFANNPAMCAYADAIALGANPDDILLLSIGTGTASDQLGLGYGYEEAKDWGLIEWAVPMLKIVFQSLGDSVEYHLGKVLPPDRYFRLQPRLTWASEALDDVSPRNVAALKADAQDYVLRASEYIDLICETLAA